MEQTALVFAILWAGTNSLVKQFVVPAQQPFSLQWDFLRRVVAKCDSFGQIKQALPFSAVLVLFHGAFR